MNILLIEDDELKAARIREYLEETYSEVPIEMARSYKSGLRILVERKAPALVVLDMSLPNFDIAPGKDGGRPHNLGGREILRQMKRRGITSPVVVVTQFDVFGSGPDATSLDELRASLAAEYSENFLGAVFYQSTADDWKQALTATVERVIGS